MAGAGFKTFNTGDVLTASDVNTYLMQQTVMVFADASARSTALGANVAEGMLSYLKDTNAVERYDGSSWGAIGAGDIEGVTAGTGLTGGGTSGTVTLDFDVANYGGGEWAAGKNKIINGALNINQRNFTSNTSGYNFDRFYNEASGGTQTITPQTFTPGTAPVTGYEATNFMRSVVASQSASGNYAAIAQKIEDVRTFAGQTITVSFWAKSSTGTPKVSVEMQQVFGTGGSSAVFTAAPAASTLSTSWVRYSSTIAIPSIAGKTLGAGSFLTMFIWVSAGSSFDARANAIGLQNATLDFWGFQVEAGSTATLFQTATGTIQGELAACTRYYYRVDSANASDTRMNTLNMIANSTTVAYGAYIFPTRMRTSPTFGSSTASGWSLGRIAAACTAMAQERASQYSSMVKATVASGLTAGNGDWLEAGNNNTAWIEFSAEL